ncbi:hypothetical protein QJS66_21420 [Kocuria rhizophila]|nr:hypothetical protein QJS66_21420 [Kocuria rhizophila]
MNANIGNSAVTSSISEEVAKRLSGPPSGALTAPWTFTGNHIHTTREADRATPPYPSAPWPMTRCSTEGGRTPTRRRETRHRTLVIEQCEQGVD